MKKIYKYIAMIVVGVVLWVISNLLENKLDPSNGFGNIPSAEGILFLKGLGILFIGIFSVMLILEILLDKKKSSGLEIDTKSKKSQFKTNLIILVIIYFVGIGVIFFEKQREYSSYQKECSQYSSLNSKPANFVVAEYCGYPFEYTNETQIFADYFTWGFPIVSILLYLAMRNKKRNT